MNERKDRSNTANFFWEGNLTNYEATSINSFVNNGFKVNLWSYSQNSFSKISDKVHMKNASNILPVDLLDKLNQNHQKANYSSFSNLFRYKLLDIYGGWWFDTDCLCQKNVYHFENLISNRDYVLGLEKKDYVGSAVMYFSNTELLNEIEENAYKLIKENKNKLKWGEIGPDLITEVAIKKGIIDKILPPNYFFPVSPNNIQELFNPGIKQDVKSKLSDTYVCHTWNEMFRKYDINKRVFPPKGSFMYSQFETHGILQSNEKIYTKALMLRFNPVISIFYKIFSRIKVTIKNYKK